MMRGSGKSRRREVVVLRLTATEARALYKAMLVGRSDLRLTERQRRIVTLLSERLKEVA